MNKSTMMGCWIVRVVHQKIGPSPHEFGLCQNNTIPKVFVRHQLPTILWRWHLKQVDPQGSVAITFPPWLPPAPSSWSGASQTWERASWCWGAILGSYYSNGACWCLSTLRYGMSNYGGFLDPKTGHDHAGFETLAESWLHFVQLWCTWGIGTWDGTCDL